MPRKVTANDDGFLRPGDRFLTTKEAAQFLHANDSTLEGWRYKRTGPRYYKHGGIVRYLLSEVMAWAKSGCVEPERKTAA